tara:strand:+ start:1991 stop:2239 length:249 start_codon:yes stop_codon:yes gene_type:complete
MKLDRRKAQAAVLDAIRARSTSYEVVQVMSLLDLMYEDVKDKLVTCKPDEVPVLQGEGRAYEALLRLFTRPMASDLKTRGSE